METQDDIVRRLAALEALVPTLQADNAALRADNARLKRLLEQDSSTSHKPPSTDPPSKTPNRHKPTKKRGPKHGHSAFQRRRAPSDHVLLHRPQRCDGGCALGDTLPELGRTRLQHIELVDKPFITTDHLLVRLRCPACKRVVRAKPPAGLSRSPHGLRARALVAALAGMAQASKRPAQPLLAWLGLKMSLGLLEQASKAAPQVKLWEWMQEQQASLCVFEDVPGVEPTNNVSERALRVAAAWRKRSQGVQSERGGEFVAGMMSVRESLSKQQRNPFTVLIDLHSAHSLGLPQPSLLPSP